METIPHDFKGMSIPEYTKEELKELITPEMIEEYAERLYGDYYLPPEPHQYRFGDTTTFKSSIKSSAYTHCFFVPVSGRLTKMKI